MLRWFWAMAMAVPLTFAGFATTNEANAQWRGSDGWNRQGGNNDWRRWDGQGRHDSHYRYDNYPRYRSQPYYYGRPYSPYYGGRYRNYDQFYGVQTPWGNFYYYDR